MTNPAAAAARVRALLKTCCRMCVPGAMHACDRKPVPPFPMVVSPGDLDPVGPLAPSVQSVLTTVSGQPTTLMNRVRLLRDGADTFTAMLELIEGAQEEILLENYIFRADTVGYGYSQALRVRASEGIDVRILHDPFGDPLGLIPLHLHFRRSAARLSMYNPPRPTRRYLRAWRDHRKLLIQDRQRVVAGGLCVADVWVGNCVRQCTWRDSAVLVEGAAAAQAARSFEGAWRDAFALTWRSRKDRQTPETVLYPPGTVPIRVLADGPGLRCTETALVAVIDAAQFEALITNQYALPTPPVTDALVRAARRGVRVELIVPPLARPWFAGLATEHRLGRLIQAGVVVWRWAGAMIHAKDHRRGSAVVSGGLDEPRLAQPPPECRAQRRDSRVGCRPTDGEHVRHRPGLLYPVLAQRLA